MRRAYWIESVECWARASGVTLTDEQADCIAAQVERHFDARSAGTWADSVRAGVESCELMLTDEQVQELADDIAISAENYGLVSGWPDAPKSAPPEPVKTPAHRKKRAKEMEEADRQLLEFWKPIFSDIGDELRKRNII